MTFRVISGFWALSMVNSSFIDGTAMTTRIMIGTTVQMTSSGALCVVLDGTGFAFALNLMAMYSISARTNMTMAISITSSQLWNQMISSITGVAAFWKFICHG